MSQRAKEVLVERMMRRRFRRRQSRCLFNTPFEEMKALEYTYNLINSVYLLQKPMELSMLCWSVCGSEGQRVLGKVIDQFITDNKDWDSSRGAYRLRELPGNVLIETIERDIVPIITERLEHLKTKKSSLLDQRMKDLQKAFKLSKEDLDILTFVYVVTVNDVLKDALFNDAVVENFASLLTFRNRGHLVLGMPRAAFLNAFDKRTLFDSYLLEDGRYLDFEISAWCIRYLSGVVARDLSPLFFSMGNKERLSVQDFSVPEEDREIIRDILCGKLPANILIHGVQGSGKSSFARALVKYLGKDLLTVRISDSGEQRDRICAINATVNLADKDKSVVLIDEADELLNSWKSFFFDSMVRKSQINALLESHDKKVIWITNRIEQMDPSTLRRFSFVLEFGDLSVATRLKILSSELRKKRLHALFRHEDLKALCQDYAVNADGIMKAIHALDVLETTDRDNAMRRMRRVLRSHERSLGNAVASHRVMRDFSHYDLKGLNASEDLDRVIGVIKSYVQGKDKGALTLLLYGAPGTGKSEFVQYLSHVLGSEVVLKRSSDILSKYVGETEQYIRDAFREAREEGKILFFDEADSFLYPRAEACHSWEKSHTNEILGQLDMFEGIAVFATNEIEGLDHAALRRFRFKIEFRPLTPEGSLRMYERLLCSLPAVKSPLTDQEKHRIRELSPVTPGDYAVVRDRYRFFGNEEITHEELISDLKREIAYKRGQTKHIGFAVTAGGQG